MKMAMHKTTKRATMQQTKRIDIIGPQVLLVRGIAQAAQSSLSQNGGGFESDYISSVRNFANSSSFERIS